MLEWLIHNLNKIIKGIFKWHNLKLLGIKFKIKILKQKKISIKIWVKKFIFIKL